MPLPVAQTASRSSESTRGSSRPISNTGGGGAVEKVNTANRPRPLDEEPAHPMAGQAINVVIAAGKRKASQLDESLTAAGKVPAQTQQPLAMPAKRIQTHRDRASVRPKRLIALVLDFFPVPVLGRIPRKNMVKVRDIQYALKPGNRTSACRTEIKRFQGVDSLTYW